MIQRILSFFVCCVIFISTTVADDVRKWTARAGGFSVEAELVDVTNGNVVLKKADNTTISVPLEKLSLADVRYINQVMREAESAIKNAVVPKSKQPAGTPAADSPATEKAVDVARPSAANPTAELAGVDDAPAKVPALAEPNRGDWQVGIDRGGQKEFKISNKLAIPFSNGVGLTETLFPAVAAPTVAFWSTGSKSGVVSWDLRSGKRIGQMLLEPSSYVQLKSLSPDGRSIALVMAGKPMVEVRSLQAGNRKIELVLDNGLSINYVAHASPDTLLVLDYQSHQLGVWDLKSKKKRHDIDATDINNPKSIALSAGGIYVALATTHNAPIRIHDLRNGALAGQLTFPKAENYSYSTVAGLCFSGDGTELAALCDRGMKSAIVVWSLKDGQFKSETPLAKPVHSLADSASSYKGPALHFLPEQRGWLAFGSAVIDRSIGGPVWVDPASKAFSSNGLARMALADGRVVAVRGSQKSSALTVQPLPWDEIERGSKIVSAGGTEEDAKMPKVSLPSNDGRLVALAPPASWTASEPAFAPLSLAARPLATDLYAFIMDELYFAGPDRSLAYLVANAKNAGDEISVDGLPKKQILRFDLKSSKSLGPAKLDVVGSFHDISLSGERMLAISGKHRDRLDIYEIDDGEHVCGFRPYSKDTDALSMITWARFIDDEHILTIKGNGSVTLWELPACKALANTRYVPAIPTNFLAETCWLSPSRKNLLLAARDGLHVLDPLTLESTGQLQSSSQMRGNWYSLAAAFAPSGTHLAAELSSGEQTPTLVVWDFTTGKLKAEHTLAVGGTQLTWADADRVLVHGFRIAPSNNRSFRSEEQAKVADLVDVQRGQMLWRYVIPAGKIFSTGPDGRLWFATSASPIGTASVCSATLPTPPALSVINKLKGPQPLLEPGGSVALDINFKPLGDSIGLDLLIERIRTSVTEQLKKRDLSVDARSSLALVVKMEEVYTGNESNFGSLTGGRQPRVSETRLSCDLTLKDVTGNALWRRQQSFYNDPERLVEAIAPGQTIESRLRAKQWDDAMKWFESPLLPDTVYEPVSAEGLGESMLSLQGESNVKIF